ncbi:metallophosphoesterase family protein [Sphingomonas turrisvirgatae]|uniref:Serine/threonine protein phosphatase n=1 Tax=Sphingomonas turrisvirgatae TaxID=1888892 RepID=A0A1E3LVC7_9SPHN|nr:metallophosphoesterase family protein [Sphingomonas turrisvirgatae]ODP37727.1 serine/threonine protein phosphatase [Sphingomonas turrisvirgatae]
MFKRLVSALSRSPVREAALRGAIPAGQRIYAVGDIHGRLDLLDDLLDQIQRDDAERGAAQTQLIFLGDLVDRGPQSAQVVDRLMKLAERKDRISFLLGNHEEVFLKVLEGDEKALRFFLRIGGRETVLSYDISQAEYDACDYAELLAMIQARVPASHTKFLHGFEDLIVLGDYAFVHAGIQPDLPLDGQKPASLRWIRDEFLNHQGPFEKVIVHGHTIFQEVAHGPGRIGLDTGAYETGRLTAMGFERDERWILQTAGTSGGAERLDAA